MYLNTTEKELLTLFVLGAAIGCGKVLVSQVALRLRTVLGQMMINAGLSVSAGAALIMFGDLSPTALVGVGALIGCGGHSTLDMVLQHYFAFHAVRARKRNPMEPGDIARRSNETIGGR